VEANLDSASGWLTREAKNEEGKMHRRALVVDDDPAVCEMVGKVLASAGLEALTLTRSTEAPGFLEEGKFDLVLLDLHMGPPDGIELARQMRQSRWHRTTPIIFISDDQRPSAMSIGFEAGANFFLYKPIDKNRLLKLIRATQGAMEHERRRTRRVPLQSKVLIGWGAEEVEGETVDVSLSGILLRAPRILPLGSPVRLSLNLTPRTRPIVGAGSVVRIQGGNLMGIQLDQLSVADSERLQEILLPMIPND
jgi:two-component system, chemotaxis family, chemotaxis protein CheY